MCPKDSEAKPGPLRRSKKESLATNIATRKLKLFMIVQLSTSNVFRSPGYASGRNIPKPYFLRTYIKRQDVQMTPKTF